ncbi:MAG: nicotinate-nucleotide--dimethylbenzimidazole phosphoribosyltransferase [Anaerolineales bacterium]|nr:nicotinate-nucleotide--dimethylbenzimidazole phosphoribosyltransferase [Anaerolineales bacterium]
MSLENLIAKIPPFDAAAAKAAGARQDRLTKPPGSLGRLEELAIQLAGITGAELPVIRDKVVIVMAADHGVTDERVSAYPREVTAQMVANFLRGGAAINVLASAAGARAVFVDMGVAADIPPHDQLQSRKIAHGTANMALGPAMTHGQALESVLAGVEVVEAEIARGADIVGTGEMGIGNTTAAAAIACVLTGAPPSRIVGRGTGIDDGRLKRKAAAVERALSVNKPDPRDGLNVLAKVGGFEIGGLAGVILGAAARRKPVMLDGFIATAAAMIAAAIAPACRPYLLSAHRAGESGHGRMLESLGLLPLLDLNLRLGEGTGAALGIALAEAACRLQAEMATFDEAGISGKA